MYILECCKRADMSYEKDITAATKQLSLLLKEYKPELETIAKITIKICEPIEKSWSCSWIGYHANLYFKDFQQPSIKEMFNIEWGGINGYDPGWQSRSLDEIWNYIQVKSIIKFDIDNANEKFNELQETADNLKTLLELNSIDEVLTHKIKDINTNITLQDYIKARKPTNIVSRDSEAIYQGIKIPPHIHCQSFAHALLQNILSAEKLLKFKTLIVNSKDIPSSVAFKENELQYMNPKLIEKVGKLYADKYYSEAVGKGFSVVKDRLRDITGKENGFPAFDDAGLYIKGSAAENVDAAFQEGVRRLLGSIDKFRNEKFHTSEGNIKEKEKALSYLHMCNLALSFLGEDHYLIKDELKNKKRKK